MLQNYTGITSCDLVAGHLARPRGRVGSSGARLADFVVENILGDVQIYMTHDCN